MIGFCQFGAGRIGAIHAGNIASHPDARLQFVVDPDRAAAERLAGRYALRSAAGWVRRLRYFGPQERMAWGN